MKNVKQTALMLLAALLLTLLLTVTAAGAGTGGNIDSYTDKSDSEELFSALDDSTKELLDELGVRDVDINELYDIGFDRLIDSFFGLLTGSLKEKASVFLSITGVLILSGVIAAVCGEEHKKGAEIIGYCAVALCAGVPFLSLLSEIKSVFVSSLVFMKAFIPVYAAAIAAGGKPMLALSFNTAVLGLGEFIVYFIGSVYAPFSGMLCCLAFTGGISDFLDTEHIIGGIRRCITFILGLSASLFSGLLTVKSVLAGSADSLSVKGVRFLIGSSVPIVGGAVSEAYASVAAGLVLVKNTIGVFGIIALAALYLPVIVEIAAWLLLLNISAILAKTLGCDRENTLLKGMSACVSLLFAGTALTLAVLIISCGVVLKMT